MKIKNKEGKIIDSDFNLKVTIGKEVIDLNNLGNSFSEEEE